MEMIEQFKIEVEIETNHRTLKTEFHIKEGEKPSHFLHRVRNEVLAAIEIKDIHIKEQTETE